MAREIGSWLSGPESSRAAADSRYPGQALGLPESGSRSLARMGRRFAALTVDWFIAYGLVGFTIPLGLMTLDTLRFSWVGSVSIVATWFALGVISVRLFGFTPGQYALGLMVIPVDNRRHVGSGRAIVRGLLIALAVPALFTDADGRGMQDRATATAVVRR